MEDVFVSYARADEELANQVADALRQSGYTVWRDDELPAHRTYADVIQERLRSAKAVVVLWSRKATNSQWVRSEADAARQLGTLVQATIDGSFPPMPFEQVQCASLSDWNGNANTSGWRKLVASIEALAASVEGSDATMRQAAREISICVLPFENMSGEAEQEYFSEGISEDITTDLSKVSALEVIARNTAFSFKGQAADVCDIARRLGVTHVLEGSVRKSGNRVRITAQLIEGAAGSQVWAERFDRDLTDIFEIQDEISEAIVAALKVNLLPDEKQAITARGTSNADAYNLYLMAHNYWVTGSWSDVRQVELVARICKRAVEVDPQYARAWGLLAIVKSILHFSHGIGGDDGLKAAECALEFDPNLAEAVVVQARHLHEQGCFDEANAELERAVNLDPDSWEVNREAARICYFQRRFSEAKRYFQKAVSIAETDYHSWGMLISVFEALGDKKSVAHAARMAVLHAERVFAQNPTNAAALSMGAIGLAVLGERDRFNEWKDRALLVAPDDLSARFNFAAACAFRLKDSNAALDLLEPAFARVNRSVFQAMSTDPDYEAIRELPRFKKMVSDAEKRLASTTGAK